MRLLPALVALLLAGCETDKVGVPLNDTTPCEIMGPHMPQQTRPADTRDTKFDAIRRNAAWEFACPDKPASP